jgi:2'-5' RNA ligase
LSIKDVEKFALWIIPEEIACRRLKEVIDRLSQEYSTPVFEPHLTLLGGLTEAEDILAKKASVLGRALKPFVIQLGIPDYRDEYYRSLFLKASETNDLMRAYEISCRVFSRSSTPPFEPHVSLMYGDLPKETREKLVSDIGDSLRMDFNVNGVHLVSTSGMPEDWHSTKEIFF